MPNEPVTPDPPASPASAPTPSYAKPKHKRYMRNYILDKKLQLRYIGAVALISVAISSLLGYLIWVQRSQASETIIRSLSADWIPDELRQSVVSNLHGSDLFVIVRMAGVCLGLIVVLSMFLVVMTHKVAGPLFKISGYFDMLREGRLPKLRDLRKGDEFQDFFRRFKLMTEALRERTSEDVAAYGRFIEACESAGVKEDGELGHGLDEMRKLKKEKETSLAT